MKKRLIALLLCLVMMAVDVNYAFAEETEAAVETEAESLSEDETTEALLDEQEVVVEADVASMEGEPDMRSSTALRKISALVIRQ